MPLSDTHPAIEALIVEGYRKMTPEQKIRKVQDLNRAALQLAEAQIRKDHPGIDEHELRLRLASRWLDRATLIRVFGWDPEAHQP